MTPLVKKEALKKKRSPIRKMVLCPIERQPLEDRGCYFRSRRTYLRVSKKTRRGMKRGI